VQSPVLDGDARTFAGNPMSATPIKNKPHFNVCFINFLPDFISIIFKSFIPHVGSNIAPGVHAAVFGFGK
jgi:hypothetical protein